MLLQTPDRGRRGTAQHNIAPMGIDSCIDDVELVFGRPNIKEYLQDIFSGKQKGTGDDVERPAQARAGGARHTREVRYRAFGS